MTDLLAKLQVKAGQTIALIGGLPAGADEWPLSDDPEHADAVLLYVGNAAELTASMDQLRSIAGRGALCWVVYPKAGKLDTDLNRDRIRESLVGLDTGRSPSTRPGRLCGSSPPEVRLPDRVAANVRGVPALEQWAAGLPETVRRLTEGWGLQVGEPFEPGGECSWVAPVERSGEQLVLKVGWRHTEAAHEADGLRYWDGDGAVRLVDEASTETSYALLLERCQPGTSLKARPEPEQDEVVASLLRRLWRVPPADSVFRPLAQMCDDWAAETPASYVGREVDSGLVGTGLALFRELSRQQPKDVLLCTDLHAQNILAAEREPWLVIDPKPYVGDPAYDVTQHMLNCEERLATDPIALARRMADLTELDSMRVTQWLFARCIQEGGRNAQAYAVARRLSTAI